MIPVVAIAVPVAAAAERRVVARLRDVGALSPNTAQQIGALGFAEGRRLGHLVRLGIVRPMPGDVYYLDEPAWVAHRARQRQRAAVMLVAVVVLMLGLAGYESLQRGHQAGEAIAVRVAIQRYDALVLAMDADAVGALFTGDGEMWNAGQLVRRGPDAIRAYLHSFDGRVHVDSQETTVTHVAVAGATVHVEGTYHQTARFLTDGQTVSVDGRVESDWVRQPDGRWLVRKMSTTAK